MMVEDIDALKKNQYYIWQLLSHYRDIDYIMYNDFRIKTMFVFTSSCL